MFATNTDRKARFEQHLVQILNFGAVNLTMGIGYRSGAFEAMDAIGRPATIVEIADRSGLDGRYLKEWLGVMVSGRVIDLIDVGEDGEQYVLPAEHADLITRRSGTRILAYIHRKPPCLPPVPGKMCSRACRPGRGSKDRPVKQVIPQQPRRPV